jgi:hypothetical protein
MSSNKKFKCPYCDQEAYNKIYIEHKFWCKNRQQTADEIINGGLD